MKQLALYTPTGDGDMNNPPATLLEEWILRKDAAEWHQGAWTLALHYDEDSLHTEMILMLEEPHGLFVHYTADDGQVYTLVNGDPFGVKVTTYDGGEPWALPVAFFAPREQALQAVEEFCRSGQRVAGLNWEDLYQHAWDAEPASSPEMADATR